jgi:hypothetical protein
LTHFPNLLKLQQPLCSWINPLWDSTTDKGYLTQALLRSGKHEEALAVYESWIDDMNESGGFDPFPSLSSQNPISGCLLSFSQ